MWLGGLVTAFSCKGQEDLRTAALLYPRYLPTAPAIVHGIVMAICTGSIY
jgi:hypothetical protein